MKFSELWLREWVNPSVSTDELAKTLTMAGLEMESIEPVASDFDQVVVGQIKTIEPHPDADKLNVCNVDVGSKKQLQIVCGASNVCVDMKVPVALVGASLPGIKIKKAKLRGVESSGMLCSAKEIGLSDNAEGLMELAVDAPIGKDIREYFWLDDQSIELSITPNRGDCLSIIGIAREVGTLCNTEVTPDQADEVEVSSKNKIPVTVEVPEDCPRYLCRVLEDINPLAVTPMWIQEALRRSGLRSISPVVDITNFVLLELGQPMHAFDLGKISGGIRIRHAKKAEPLTLLDGQEIKLTKGTMVIADESQPVALAGIMGGADSAVSDSTTSILLESAFFNPLSIAGRARTYGLHTDSSHRYERGVDPELQRRAIDRATGLLIKTVGGKAGPIVEVVNEDKLPERNQVTLRASRIKRVLGQEIPSDVVENILNHLELAVEPIDGGWAVTAPSFRFDIEIEEDLIEEVARVYGYDKLPTTLPDSGSHMQASSESQVATARLQEILVSRGYHEAITYSFIDPEHQQLFSPGETPITLSNPISADMSVMRTSHWPGLAQAVSRNLNRQQNNVKFFESGLKFLGQGADIKQERFISGMVTGSLLPEQWGEKSRSVDFFDLKGDVEALLATIADSGTFSFESEEHEALQPGQTAGIYDAEGHKVGIMGALHPTVESRFGIDQRVYVFEIELKCFENARIPHFEPLSKYPEIRRDIALVMDEDITINQLEKVVKEAASELLTNFQLFDVYQGKGIDSGSKSVAFGLTFQGQSRTLEEADVEGAMAPILSAFEHKLGATLRT
jgi:phenylalanyl-tRNA synthetase beta chain